MNNPRRKQIISIVSQISEIKEELDCLAEELESIKEEEEEYRDNMPENLQASERYEKAETAVDAMESAAYSVSEAISYIETAQE